MARYDLIQVVLLPQSNPLVNNYCENNGLHVNEFAEGVGQSLYNKLFQKGKPSVNIAKDKKSNVDLFVVSSDEIFYVAICSPSEINVIQKNYRDKNYIGIYNYIRSNAISAPNILTRMSGNK